MLFLHCRNCDSLAVVVVVAHLTLIWLAAISPPQGELTTASVVSSLGLSYTFSKTNFTLIPEVSRNLFVHRALILREKEILYCLANTKDLRLSVLCHQSTYGNYYAIQIFHATLKVKFLKYDVILGRQ